MGALRPSDPPTTTGGAAPTVFLPAAPAKGDEWKPEDLLPVVDETSLVVRRGVPIQVPGGRFPGCLEVLGRSTLDARSETKWWAPVLGVVRTRTRGESLRLQASTLRRR